MVADVADISTDSIRTASERLNQVHVFADEERKYPSLSQVRQELPELEARLRSEGYHGGPIAVLELDRPREGVNFAIYDSSKIGNPSLVEPTWHRDYEQRWRNQVGARVNDWIERLRSLRSVIQSWLPNGMSIVDRPPIRMHEELMRRFGIPDAEMPTFEVIKDSRRVMRFQPKGLWVIGANGRVDLVTEKTSWILVDKSEPLSGIADWHYYAPNNRRSPTRFDQDRFIDLLR
jgi:hypothetical protein